MARILEVGVKAFIQNGEGKYLVLLRAMPFYGEDFNRWDVPGGRIEMEETLEEALKREVLEETGLAILKIHKILHVQDLLRNPKKHTVRITYLAECEGADITLHDVEHSEYKWVTLDELKELKYDLYLTPVLQKLS